MNSAKRTSSFFAFSARMRVPRRQVSITTISAAPTASGIQPPSTIFSMFAIRKTRSMARKGAMTSAAVAGRQRQHFHMTRKAIAVVITIVPVTAMP